MNNDNDCGFPCDYPEGPHPACTVHYRRRDSDEQLTGTGIRRDGRPEK